MDIGVLAQNMRRLRVKNNLSQKDLADRAGISVPSVSNLENQRVDVPRVRTIRLLAKALNVSVHELLAPVQELKSVRFRSSRKMRTRENILAEVSQRLGSFNFVENVVGDKREFLFREVIPHCSAANPREAAHLCRKALNLKSKEPIHDICGLLEYAGVKVLPISMASEGFFGLSVAEEDGGPAVVVNTWDQIPVERWIFSAAHELGHLILHREAFDVGESVESEEEENQANVFAAYFLMPDEGFKSEWNDASGLNWIDAVMKVKRIFNVSYKTILVRLIDHGVVDNSIWKKFNLAYKKRFRQRLPFKEEPWAIESPEPFSIKQFDFFEDRLSRLTRRAIESEQISLGKGAEILGVPLSEMRHILQSWVAVL